MVLQHLDLVAFKSIAIASCHFSPKLNCFFGGNGMGKTNLLDAIHYLSMTRSHLGTIDRMAIRHGASEALITGSFLAQQGAPEEIITLRIRGEQGKVLSRNGRLYKRLSEHIGRFPLVIISPQDYRLIRGGSEERRNFLNRLLSQQDPTYLTELIRYEYALNQRNNLLRSEQKDDMLFSVVEEQMAYSGCAIAQKRAVFVERFTPIFNEYYHTISADEEQVSLAYQTKTGATPEEFLSSLQSFRSLDLATGHSAYGIHKDDIEMLLEEYPIRKIGSEGQNKTYLTALKLAEYHLLSQQLDSQPLLLLDDLFDKLDAERVEHIIQIVSGPLFGQIFITDTNRKYLDAIIEAQGDEHHLFEVNRGEINLLNN